MPPVVAAAGAAFTAVSGAFAAAGAGAATSLGLGTGAATLFTSAFTQLASGVALTALGQALAPKPETQQQRVSGVKISPRSGEAQPQSFILGRYATAGDLVFHGSYNNPGDDTPNDLYVQVFELSDLPVTRILRLLINGEWAELEESTYEDRGQPVRGYRNDGKDKLWVKTYDGTQTEADAQLVARFGSDYAQPWSSSAVGHGIAYIVMTAGYQPKIHNGRPEVLVEMEGIPLYDPRKDSSVGGNGPQRLNNMSTWRFSENPQVMKYNIHLGIRDSITGRHFWGGQKVLPAHLPLSVWFAAMNECDRQVDGAPAYTAGLEVRVDEEPASVLEELDRACSGKTVEVAGTWLTHAGKPAQPVYFISDEDIVVTSAQSFKPFPQLTEAYNGVRATYPDPNSGWQPKDAPARDKPEYLLADGGRENIADLKFNAVHSRNQIQRLMEADLKDSRRFRTHALVLPPEARALTPIDTIGWTSVINGYPDAKVFDLPMTEALPGGNTAVGLRERNPNDYDYDGVQLPTDDGFGVKPPRQTSGSDAFSVEPAQDIDGDGNPVAPAIRLLWTIPEGEADAVRYWVRRADNHNHIPVAATAGRRKGRNETAFMRLNGQAARLNNQPVRYAQFSDVEDGQLLITGRRIRPLTEYEVQAIFTPTDDRERSDWMPVTTPDIRLKLEDFEDEVRDVINDARDKANQAAQDVIDVQATVNALDEQIEGLNQETLDRADAILAALAGLDAAAIEDLTGVAVAGLRGKSWVKDPTFREWEGTGLKHWSGAGVSAYATKETGEAYYGTGLRFTVPAGSANANVSASSAIAGQMPGANLKAEWVIISALIKVFSGSLAGARLRVEWQAPGSTVWQLGNAFGQMGSSGPLDTAWGFDVDANRFQSDEVFWQKPFAGTAGAIRLTLVVKQPTPTQAVDLRVDYLGVTRATRAEVAGFLANGLAEASVEELRLEITGPGGAIAASIETLTATYGEGWSQVIDGKFALASDTQAMASTINALTVTFGDQNLVRNSAFADGPRPEGEAPNFWTGWPANGVRVAQRNAASESANVRNAPTQFYMLFEADGVERQARAFDDMPVRPDDELFVALAVALTDSSPSGTIQVRMTFFSEPGVPLDNVVVRSYDIAGVGVGWVRPEWTPIKVPNAAALARMNVRSNAGRVGRMLVTHVECRKGDPVAAAEIKDVRAVKVDAEGAVAAYKTHIAAEFSSPTVPGYNAWVEQVGTAFATSREAGSAMVFRNSTNGKIGLYGWSNEDGSGNAITLDAQNVLISGTVSAGEIVVLETGANMVIDGQLQSPTYWNNRSKFQIIKDTSSPNADSKGELRWIGGNAVPDNCSGDVFTVRAGFQLTCSAEIARIGGTRHAARARLRWSAYNGDYIGFQNIGPEIDSTSPDIVSVEETIIVPAGVRRAQFDFQVNANVGGGNVRFFAPEVIRQHKGSVLITPDGAFMEMLQAKEAWILEAMIGSAQIGRANIQHLSINGVRIEDFAVSSISASSTNGNTAVSASTFNTVQTLTVNRSGKPMVIFIDMELSGTAGFTGNVEIRLRRDSAVMRTFNKVVTSTFFDGFSATIIDNNNEDGNTDYILETKASFSGSLARSRSIAAVDLKK